MFVVICIQYSEIENKLKLNVLTINVYILTKTKIILKIKQTVTTDLKKCIYSLL